MNRNTVRFAADDASKETKVSELKIERLPAVLARTGLARSTLYAAIEAGEFPPPVPIAARAVGFLSTEVDQWIAKRAQLRAARRRT